MRTIISKTLLLSFMAVFAVSTAMAQPKSYDVEPASKGNLPTLPDLPAPGQDGVLPVLEVECVHGVQLLGGGFYYETWLRFPSAEEFGGTHYTLQYPSNENWETWSDEDGYPYEFGSGSSVGTCSPSNSISKYRLVLHGGPKDGWVSNVVSSPYMRISQCFVTGWVMNYHVFAVLVGDPIPGLDVTALRYNYSKTEPEKEFDKDCPYYRYNWYRRNPNTGDMTKIANATEKGYTPTMEDVGYELVEVVTGDDEHLSLYQTHNYGFVQFPVEASIEYLDSKGFVLNSAYVLPDGGAGLRISAEAGTPEGETEAFAEGAIKEKKAGQYAVSMKRDDYDGHELRYEDNRYKISFLYDMPVWDDEGNLVGEVPTHREAQLLPERYEAPLMVKTFCGDQVVNGTIDVIGKNWEGKLEIVSTMTTEQLQEEGLFLPAAQQYYVKIRKTDNTMETYYPDALSWGDAKPIEPLMYDGSDDFHATTATIEVQPILKPLTGKGKITGKVNISGNTARSKLKKAEGDAATTYTVYLKDKSNNSIIAMTETDAEGNYQFDNVPVGSYIVIPNVEGYKVDNKSEATITEESSVVNVDCVMSEVKESELFPESSEEEDYLAGDADGNGTVDAQDIAAIVDYLLGKTPEKFNKKNADANNDKLVNMTDIVKIVDIITGKE